MDIKQTQRGESWVIVQMVWLALIALAPRKPFVQVWPRVFKREGAAAGFALGMLGGLVALFGARDLGANLTPFPRPRENGMLIQSGVYAWVRHPIYTGIVLAALGWSFARKSLIGVLLSVGLGFFFDRKAAREEDMLRVRYSEYADYQKQVRKFLPFIY